MNKNQSILNLKPPTLKFHLACIDWHHDRWELTETYINRNVNDIRDNSWYFRVVAHPVVDIKDSVLMCAMSWPRNRYRLEGEIAPYYSAWFPRILKDDRLREKEFVESVENYMKLVKPVYVDFNSVRFNKKENAEEAFETLVYYKMMESKE